MQSVDIPVIGRVHSPFREKFGIPRQPGLVPAAHGRIELLPPWNTAEAVRGLEDMTHIWVNFIFHQVPEGEWQPTVRPPRLGGNERVGVFASRSPFRPGRLGLSVLKLEGIDTSAGVELLVSGLDLLDGTPVVDIRPYIPWCDSVPDAQGGYAHERPSGVLQVDFSDQAAEQLKALPQADHWQQLIVQSLQLDARPRFHEDSNRIYGMRLGDVDVRWQQGDGQALVVELNPLPSDVAGS